MRRISVARNFDEHESMMFLREHVCAHCDNPPEDIAYAAETGKILNTGESIGSDRWLLVENPYELIWLGDAIYRRTDVVAPLRRLSENFMNNDNAIAILEATCGSKLCFLDNSGDISVIGDFIEHDGILYSNSTFNKRVYNYNSYRSYYDEYGYGYGYGYREGYDSASDTLFAMYAQLPWEACEMCDEAHECVMTEPFCRTSLEADEFVAEETGWETKGDGVWAKASA